MRRSTSADVARRCRRRSPDRRACRRTRSRQRTRVERWSDACRVHTPLAGRKHYREVVIHASPEAVTELVEPMASGESVALDALNPPQAEAVAHADGPLIVFA